MKQENSMKSKKLTRRILQYIAGLVCMAIGLVLLKRTYWGVSPITAVPDAVASFTPLSLGNATILLHVLCVVLQIAVQRRVTVKSLLTLCVGVPFGYLVDLFMWLYDPGLPAVWAKCIMLVLGIAVQGFGVALISGCDMMLPAPDEFNNVVSRVCGKKLSNVKMIADGTYVVIAIVINIISVGSLASVGVGTIAAVLLTGRCVGLSYTFFPGIRMEPFFNAPKDGAET